MSSEACALALVIVACAIHTRADHCSASQRAPVMLQLSTSNAKFGQDRANRQAASLESNTSGPASRLWSDIPKIIHQTWKTSTLPGAFQRWSRTWRDCMPDWEYRLHTDEDNRNLFVNDFPELLQLYDSYPMDIMRVDAARLAYMAKYGGLYVDLDMECISDPFRKVSSPNGIILACEGCDRISNAFMAGGESAKGFFKYLLYKLPDSAPNENSSGNPLRTTGPLVITYIVEALINGSFRTEAGTVKSLSWKNDTISARFPNVTIFDNSLVFGIRWNDTQRKHKSLDGRWVKDHFSDSASISHWTNSWGGGEIPN